MLVPLLEITDLLSSGNPNSSSATRNLSLGAPMLDTLKTVFTPEDWALMRPETRERVVSQRPTRFNNMVEEQRRAEANARAPIEAEANGEATDRGKLAQPYHY